MNVRVEYGPIKVNELGKVEYFSWLHGSPHWEFPGEFSDGYATLEEAKADAQRRAGRKMKVVYVD